MLAKSKEKKKKNFPHCVNLYRNTPIKNVYQFIMLPRSMRNIYKKNNLHFSRHPNLIISMPAFRCVFVFFITLLNYHKHEANECLCFKKKKKNNSKSVKCLSSRFSRFS